MEGSIIRSLLDTDFYKFTMGQLVFLRYPDVPVKYAFKNRTKRVLLAEFIDEAELRAELDHVRTLRFNNSELHYLRGTNEYEERMFVEPYLEFLKDLQLPEYHLEQQGGSYRLEFAGKWSEQIYWETFALAIINELYYRSQMKEKSKFEKEVVYARGNLRLAEKIKRLRKYPDITFCDFGTRRRFSREWQKHIIEVLAQEMPKQFIGTSNVKFAMDYGLIPIGTSAHELDMVMSGVMYSSDEEIRASHNQVLHDWWDQYGWGLSIALTDTYGSDFFFRDMTSEQARNWKGLRQDSGDPIEFAKKAIKFYQSQGIDSREKLLIFSDGLDVDSIIKIANFVRGKTKFTFGWGTNLTNDLGFDPISIVVKIVESSGHGVVKLSDNLAKAIGKPEDIENFKHIFGYTGTTYKECKT